MGFDFNHTQMACYFIFYTAHIWVFSPRNDSASSSSVILGPFRQANIPDSIASCWCIVLFSDIVINCVLLLTDNDSVRMRMSKQNER